MEGLFEFFTEASTAATMPYADLPTGPCDHPTFGSSSYAPFSQSGIEFSIAGDSEGINFQVEDVVDATIGFLMDEGRKEKRAKVDVGCRIGFRMKSEVEVVDDGFKWRKYGKKSVKNSPNPRNYYRCSIPDCGVKKRVERDREDRRYVITTYEGVHNHTSPSVLSFVCPPLLQQAGPSTWLSGGEMHPVPPSAWAMQDRRPA